MTITSSTISTLLRRFRQEMPPESESTWRGGFVCSHGEYSLFVSPTDHRFFLWNQKSVVLHEDEVDMNIKDRTHLYRVRTIVALYAPK
jgi:hypothetical protein